MAALPRRGDSIASRRRPDICLSWRVKSTKPTADCYPLCNCCAAGVLSERTATLVLHAIRPARLRLQCGSIVTVRPAPVHVNIQALGQAIGDDSSGAGYASRDTRFAAADRLARAAGCRSRGPARGRRSLYRRREAPRRLDMRSEETLPGMTCRPESLPPSHDSVARTRAKPCLWNTEKGDGNAVTQGPVRVCAIRRKKFKKLRNRC